MLAAAKVVLAARRQEHGGAALAGEFAGGIAAFAVLWFAAGFLAIVGG